MPDGVLHFLKGLASRANTPNGAKLSEFLLIHSALLVVAASIFAIIYLSITRGEFGLTLTATLIGIAILGALLASWCFQAAEFADQHGRDLEAHRVFVRVMKGSRTSPYGVLVRPFSARDLLSSNALPATPFGKMLSNGPVYFGPPRPLSMEPQLRRAFEKTTGPLITFGAPTYGDGAGRTPISARDWAAGAGELTDKARLIFFVPGIDESSKNDLEELLKSGFIRRTVIVEPGARDEVNANDVEAATVIRWNSLRAIFAKHGYALPTKSEHGALIYFGVAGAEPRVMSFGTWHTRKLELFLQFVSQQAQRALKTSPVNTVAAAQAATRKAA
ncbi:MAG: hypothetical protein CME88_01995 [Hirschia sp.]|nr:hypothetical protein [Hirschia sp.]MBF17134.1 hypothetical protein [Hirschia sp.]|tara:strand:+ start:112 stop:1107 length:996 start_codon:yes stop_codon:yes gene_type:complete